MFGELKKPQGRYIWTTHAQYKLRQYRLSESLVKRVIRFPTRVEEGIVDETIAVMRPAQSKNYSEIWAMYVPTKTQKLRIITAWRYPGKSPERDPVPQDILNEVRSILF